MTSSSTSYREPYTTNKGIMNSMKVERYRRQNNLNDRFQIYNKEMESVDWNDVNVLRKLPDGWYSIPSDSKYGEMINKDPDKV